MIKLKKDFYPNSSLWKGYFVYSDKELKGYVVNTRDNLWTLYKDASCSEVLSKHKTLKQLKQSTL
jgi:hypothetical protein